MARSVVRDRPLFARGLYLNGCLTWRLPIAHVVTAMPGAYASWPSGIITSGSTCAVARLVSERGGEERVPQRPQFASHHAGLSQGTSPSLPHRRKIRTRRPYHNYRTRSWRLECPLRSEFAKLYNRNRKMEYFVRPMGGHGISSDLAKELHRLTALPRGGPNT